MNKKLPLVTKCGGTYEHKSQLNYLYAHTYPD